MSRTLGTTGTTSTRAGSASWFTTSANSRFRQRARMGKAPASASGLSQAIHEAFQRHFGEEQAMMPNEKPELTLDDLEHIDIEELFRAIDAADARRKLRKDRPWGRDIIQVLWKVRPWMSMDQLTRKLWTLRNPS